ncbi:MAG TPA: alpha-glucan family phosphorylase [Myxococcota bacterium]|nr:alpha-glucan family phosphorylase [Myxococcota bacterium]
MIQPPSRPLSSLAQDLWWTWNPDARRLVEGLDPERYEELGHSLPALLAERPDLEDPAAAALVGAMERYRAEADTWASRNLPQLGRVAYFSMEFGLHESLRIYSGGLGVLAGDHVRSASDLGLDFVAVGLFYAHGYFRQIVDRGEQASAWPANIPWGLEEMPQRIVVPDGERTYQARIWRQRVGRVELFLLDADVPGNDDDLRAITGALYGGDTRMRIRQEVLLGIGGVRALQALDRMPEVLHLNEGHCALAPMEWMRSCGDEDFVRSRTVFTTHTPVPAGHDRFDWHLVDEVLGPWRRSAGWDEGALMDRGRMDPSDLATPLNMTKLAMTMSRACNGVSALHGEVSRRMFDDDTIGHVTNGVHPTFWMADELQRLLDGADPGWREALVEGAIDLSPVSDGQLWAARKPCRDRLRAAVARRAGVWLPEESLICGFARRFAPYKRADLLLSDEERLSALLARGLRIVYAGKAHPRDEEGRRLVARVLKASRDFRGQVVFLEGYDIALGRLLTQGADLWLNTPRRPREASGTSGQKVVLNGGLNASVLDGWWPEGFDGDNGWAIGATRAAASVEEQDAADAESLYQVLEGVLETWTDRPRWLGMVRASMSGGIPRFNTHRMVAQYARDVYSPVSSQPSTSGSVSSQS